MGAGKLKAVVQNVFIGATIAWFAWKDAIAQMHLAGDFRNFWDQFHGWFVARDARGRDRAHGVFPPRLPLPLPDTPQVGK